MDTRFSYGVMSVPLKSTRRLLLSEPYQSHCSLSTSSKINGIGRSESSGPKLVELVKHKFSYGAKMLPLVCRGRIFRKNFSTRDGEKLLHASQCHLYTTAGAISGILFISNERVGFCSDRSLRTYSTTTGELLKFQYKVSVPLGKMKGVGESMNMQNPSDKYVYVELVTVDEFSFWFLRFPNYKKTLKHLHQTISSDCLSC